MKKLFLCILLLNLSLLIAAQDTLQTKMDANKIDSLITTKDSNTQALPILPHSSIQKINFNNYPYDSTQASTHKLKLFEDAKTLNKTRIVTVSGSTLVALAGSYWYLNNAWWSGEKTRFKFDGGYKVLDMFSLGKDAIYAINLDKFGHFYGGHIGGEFFYQMSKWAGKSEKSALVWGGVLGSSVALFIEVKDGFSPTWGFSLHDFAAGSLGSFYPYFQSKSRLLNAIDLKYSYYRRNDYYFNAINYTGDFQDDYSNVTLWYTFNPKRYSPKSKWPKWLGISVGVGIDDTWNNYNLGRGNVVQGVGAYEFFLAPDIDFRGLLPNKPIWQKVARVLNFIKFPAPTLRFGRTTQILPFYF